MFFTEEAKIYLSSKIIFYPKHKILKRQKKGNIWSGQFWWNIWSEKRQPIWLKYMRWKREKQVTSEAAYCFHSRSEDIWKDLTDESHQLRSKLFANFFTNVSSLSVHWCLSLAFPTMFVVYKLQLAQTSNKLTTRWKLKSLSIISLIMTIGKFAQITAYGGWA